MKLKDIKIGRHYYGGDGAAMSEIELKPCPFCGDRVEIVRAPFGTYPFRCNGCGANVLFDGAESPLDKAVEAWNTRAERTCEVVEIPPAFNFDLYGNVRVYGSAEYVCSECREEVGCDDSYCPSCGAKVVEE